MSRCPPGACTHAARLSGVAQCAFGGLQPQAWSRSPYLSWLILIPSNNPRKRSTLLSTETSTGKSTCYLIKPWTHLFVISSVLCLCWSSSSNRICLLCSQTRASLVVTHTSNTLIYYRSGEPSELWLFLWTSARRTFLLLLPHTAPVLAASAPSCSCQQPLTPPLSIPFLAGSLQHQHEETQHPASAAPSCWCRSALVQPSQDQPGQHSPSQAGISKIHKVQENLAPLLLAVVYCSLQAATGFRTDNRRMSERVV